MGIFPGPAALAALSLLSLPLTAGSVAIAQTSPAPPAPPAPMTTPLGTPTPMMTAGPTVTPAPLGSASPSAAPLAQASPTPIATPVNPPENPLVTDRVRTAFLAWQRGHIDRKTYSPYAGGTYVGAYVAVVSPVLAIGAPQAVTYQTATLLLNDLVYRYEIDGTSGTVSVLYSLDQNGRTDGVVFTPEIFRTGGAPH